MKNKESNQALSAAIVRLIDHFHIEAAVAVMELNGERSFFRNEHVRFHAASIIKTAILAETFHQIEQNRLKDSMQILLSGKDIVNGGVLQELHPGLMLTVEDLMRLMIVVSDNTASNILLTILGMEHVNNFICNAGLFDTKVQKLFMVPHANPDVYNYTTVYDTVLLLRKLYCGELLSPVSTDALFSIMKRQHYIEKIPKYLPSSVAVANKTGELSDLRHDSAVVFHGQNPYALAIFTDKLKDTAAADDLIAEISRAVYRFFTGEDIGNPSF